MFRLEYLKLTKHPQLGDLELFLSEKNEQMEISKPYSSVLIGPNGTGKSYILRTIAEIFRQFSTYALSEKKELNLPFDFHIRYRFYHNVYEIVVSKSPMVSRRANKEYAFFKNRPLEKSFYKEGLRFLQRTSFEVLPRELEYPEKILVTSVIPTDRFIQRNSLPNDQYQYLGARATRSSTSTKSSIRRTINHIFNAAIEGKEFIQNLKELLLFLDFEDSFDVEYTTRINKLFFSGSLSIKDFVKYYENWWDEDFIYSKRKEKNPSWSIPYYNNNFKNNNALLIKIVEYLNKISNENIRLKQKPNSTSKIISIDLFDQNLTEYDLKMISHLENLDIINLNGIRVRKKGASFSISEISSGEYHLLISMIGIFANISSSSLILIDEPEISLHPNWQMQYISFLKKVFYKFSSCHFILATHSHFLISDLEGQSSHIIALKRENNNLETIDLPDDIDTYCWSPDDVLYNIFGVVSSRNVFVASQIAKILEMLSKGNKDEISKLPSESFNKLKYLELSLKDGDPLKKVVIAILNKIIL